MQALLVQHVGSTTPVLLDVREEWELQTAPLKPASGHAVTHIPMRELPARLSELNPEMPIVAICHHGTRSMQVAYFLAQNGFDAVINLAGGTEAWSLQVDPSVPRY